MSKTSRSVQRVQDALVAYGLSEEVETFPASTRTAEDAARAVGCQVAQIAKSLVFRTREGSESVLIIAFGRIWAAAGRPDTVFAISPEELLRVTGGTVIDVK
ncbi:MAG: hypothetical protein WD273_07690 [Trueperaceae bacterium]